MTRTYATLGSDGILDVSQRPVIAGTVFPAGPSTEDRFYRTDRNLEYYYDGTRWLTTQLFEAFIVPVQSGNPNVITTFSPVTYPVWNTAFDAWLVDIRWAYTVQATHSAIAYWTAEFHKFVQGGADTTVSSLVTDKASVGVWLNPAPTAIGALMGTTITMFYIAFVVTGAAGPFVGNFALRYRLVG